ncbi:MAG TPA: hypothetical protein VLV48_02925, partial [Thermoanaerobaculia bacterium]|nr:hypothetical protein [Thermoanaerobaculia bacterium]
MAEIAAMKRQLSGSTKTKCRRHSMKKTLTVMSLVLLVAGAAMAGTGDELFVSPNAVFSTTTSAVAGATGNYATGLLTGPSTTNNDDSCDISVMPAATLLLPYFEVDFASASSGARNTVFTLTNVTEQPQIAHVTIWTDWSYPVIDFNLWLTGYDVVPVSLYEILRNGQIPPTGYDISNIGVYSVGSATTGSGNPNHDLASIGDPDTGCASLPGPINGTLLGRIQTALTTGVYGTCTRAGGANSVAVGYVTVDVANKCSQLLPDDPAFYTNDILWDNSLIGEYMIINSSTTSGNFAGGNPMVHIRAIPEGGPLANAHLGTPAFTLSPDPVLGRVDATAVTTNFPFTFYDRYTGAMANPEIDRRQPLPGRFAARYIQDTATGPTGFATNLIIWREGGDTGVVECSSTTGTAWNNGIPAQAITRFDEQENPNVSAGCRVSPCAPEIFETTHEETQSVATSNTTFFPPDNTVTADLGGWMYMDLNGMEGMGTATVAPLNGRRTNFETQNWVAIQMFAEGRYSVLYDAAQLENGCTPALTATDADAETAIRPGANFVP